MSRNFIHIWSCEQGYYDSSKYNTWDSFHVCVWMQAKDTDAADDDTVDDNSRKLTALYWIEEWIEILVT